MFESICVTRQTADGPGPVVDMGLVAEALLFYRRVVIVGHRHTLKHVVTACGPETLLDLMEAGHLEFFLETRHSAIATQDIGTPAERHSVVSIERQRAGLEVAGPEVFSEVVGKSGRGRRLGRRFVKSCRELPYDTNKILSLATSDFRDPALLTAAVRTALRIQVPEYLLPDPLRFEVVEQSGTLRIETNVDWQTANAIYHRRIPPSHSSLTPALLLSQLVATREHLDIGSITGGELLVSPVFSGLAGMYLDGLLNRVQRSTDNRQRFQEMIFSNGRAVRDAINNGHQSMAALLPVLEKAREWKKWLADQPPSADLLAEYYRRALATTWVDSAATKTARWAVFTGLGVGADILGTGGLGTALGIGISAADATLVERLFKGWAPHRFVEEHVRRFVEPTKE